MNNVFESAILDLVENASDNQLYARAAGKLLGEIAKIAEKYDLMISILAALVETGFDTTNELFTEGETIAQELYEEYLALSRELNSIIGGPLNLTTTYHKYRNFRAAALPGRDTKIHIYGDLTNQDTI